MADKKTEAMRFWTPTHEAEFQKFMAFDPAVTNWKRSFQAKYGEAPNLVDDPTFDYRQAWLAGNSPKAIDGDTVPHWDSRGKAEDHPTKWMNDFMEHFGVSPTELPGGKATPAQQEFLSQELLRHYVEDAVKRPGYTPEAGDGQ